MKEKTKKKSEKIQTNVRYPKKTRHYAVWMDEFFRVQFSFKEN